MAASNRRSPGSSRRESVEMTNQSESLASNNEFMQLLRILPDYLVRLERKIIKLEKEEMAASLSG